MLSCQKIIVTLTLVGLLIFSNGCMTFDHIFDADQKLEMYGGTKSSYNYLSNEYSPFFGSVIRLIDFPLTAVGDTLMLPVSAPIELSR